MGKNCTDPKEKKKTPSVRKIPHYSAFPVTRGHQSSRDKGPSNGATRSQSVKVAGGSGDTWQSHTPSCLLIIWHVAWDAGRKRRLTQGTPRLSLGPVLTLTAPDHSWVLLSVGLQANHDPRPKYLIKGYVQQYLLLDFSVECDFRQSHIDSSLTPT